MTEDEDDDIQGNAPAAAADGAANGATADGASADGVSADGASADSASADGAAIDGATDQAAAPDLPQRLPLAGLLLLVPPNWNLHPLDATRILARRNPVGGILTIASTPRDRLPPDPSYEECLAQARRTFDPDAALASFDGTMRDTATGPLGVASFHKKNDFLRAVYCLRPAGLIFGVYSCAWDLRNKPDWQIGRAESESIIATAAFNRPLTPPPFPKHPE